MTQQEIIKQRRMELGLTQAELARLCGVARSTISRFESENCRMSGCLAMNFNKYLNIPIENLWIRRGSYVQERTDELTFTEVLVRAREASGFSIEEAAEKLGVSSETLVLWEEGVDSPTLDIIQSMAKVYVCTVFSLIEPLCSEDTEKQIERNTDVEHLCSRQSTLLAQRVGAAYIGTRLRSVRCSLGISRREVASVLNVSASLITAWEEGKRYPTLKRLKEVCSYYDVDISEVFSELDIDVDKLFVERGRA